ncbi:MAG: hypothetical protein Q9212_002788 [Teloschistes hypoglaucus]
MGMRLPGGINWETEFWDMLINKKNGRCIVPKDRYNVEAFYDPSGRPGPIKSKFGYFLNHVDLQYLDTSFFSMNRKEVEELVPQQKLLLEVIWECMENAGQAGWRGKNIGCYVGVFREDWLDIAAKDPQHLGMYRITGSADFAISKRVSYEFDLTGPRYPIRAVIRATAINCDGKTPGTAYPSLERHEAMMRRAYQVARLPDLSETAYVECYGTGTVIGDPLEVTAITNVFGQHGVYIGSCPISHQTICTYSQVVLESASSLEQRCTTNGIALPDKRGALTCLCFQELIRESLKRNVANHQHFVEQNPHLSKDLAHTLGVRREHLANRAFCVTDGTVPLSISLATKTKSASQIVLVFIGQPAQWVGMAKQLWEDFDGFRRDIREIDYVLAGLPYPPSWKIEEELLKSDTDSRINQVEFSQLLYVVGHSSGEIAAAYATNVITARSAITVTYSRGQVSKLPTRASGMLAIGIGRGAVTPYLIEGIIVACEDSPENVTLSGDKNRVTREWRLRKFPSHELLGSRILEGNDLEPTWRNPLEVDGLPWLQHHKVFDHVVFPAAGYIAMRWKTFICQGAPEMRAKVKISRMSKSSVDGDAIAMAGSTLAMEMRGVHFSLLEDQAPDTAADSVAEARLQWKPDIDVLPASQLMRPLINVKDDITTGCEKIYDFHREIWDCRDFFDLLGHAKPTLGILEIGAGTGGTAAVVLDCLSTQIDGPRYSEYCYTDISAGFFVAAQERFKAIPNVDYKVLDISKDPMDQGFQPESYDLILACNRRHPDETWLTTYRTILPGWWLGKLDDRPYQPNISVERWDQELQATGFSGVESVVFGEDQSYLINVNIVSGTAMATPRPKAITLLCDDRFSAIAEQAEAVFVRKGYRLNYGTINDLPAAEQDIVSVMDLNAPFFDGISPDRLRAFQRYIGNLGSSGGTVEHQVIPDRLQRSTFPRRSKEQDVDPDWGYAVIDGVINVPRYHWISVANEPLAVPSQEEELPRKLLNSKAGPLQSLHWIQGSPVAVAPDEIDIETVAVGLNFKNILVCMGVVEATKTGLGLEGAGVVRSVGQEVKDFVAGDRVMTFGHGCFSTCVAMPAKLCTKIPDDLSFEEAATLPCVYGTVIHSLLTIGRLEKGQVFATVGNEETVQYLIRKFDIARNRIFNFRNSSFLADVK